MLLLCGVQVFMLSLYWRTLRKADVPTGDGPFPPMLVILCLRGADPFLRESLTRLLASDYPSVRFRIVIDSAEDPRSKSSTSFCAKGTTRESNE